MVNDSHDELDIAGAIYKTILSVVVLLALLGAGLYFFEEPIHQAAEAFVESQGAWGIFAIAVGADGVSLPVPIDLVMAMGMYGGLSWWVVGTVASLGSTVGGVIGWWIGKKFSNTAMYRRLMDRLGGRFEAAVRRHGVKGLILGALTPLPYSIFTWMAGSIHMPLRTFMTVALLRWVRMFGYLLAMRLGLASFF